MLENRNIAIFLVALIILGGLILARPDFESIGKENVANQVAQAMPPQSQASVKIPGHAIEVSPGVFFLGTEVKDGRMLEGYAIVDYKEGFGKPSGCNNDGKCQGWEDAGCDDCVGAAKPSNCFEFLAKGAKWKWSEDYVVNPTNKHGLSETFVMSNFAGDIEKWENVSQDIIGQGSKTSQTLFADMYATDGRNEVYFGDIQDVSAIAVTVIWGVFQGPPSTRYLDEWDMVFDEADYAWSSSGEPGKMDFENIATHELGHAVGLGDLYQTECSDETMYGYAGWGETKKRTLEAGDITGVQKLYR